MEFTCPDCGVQKLIFSEAELDESASAPNIKWKCYEYVTVGKDRSLIGKERTRKKNSLENKMYETKRNV